MKRWGIGAAVLALCAAAMAAQAEIVVSANDGKQLRPGDTVPGFEPDNIAVLDLSGGRLKLLGAVAAPATITGPPHAVAVSRDSRLAIVTSSQKRGAGTELLLDDVVSAVDLSSPANPRIVQTLHAGPGASGISISPNGQLALVASTGDDSVTVFSITGRRLSLVDKLTLASGAGPTDAVFTPDGRSAAVMGRGNSRVMMLAVDGRKVTDTGRAFATGRSPYGGVITRDGKYLINTNLQGDFPPGVTGPSPAVTAPLSQHGTISMTELAGGRVVASAEVGPTPEHVGMSPDGRYVAVVVQNNSAVMRSDPAFAGTHGLLHVFAVGAGTLTKIATAETGHWCQGAVFSRDNKTVLLQCAVEREVEVFRFDGSSLTWDRSAGARVGGRPSAMASAASH